MCFVCLTGRHCVFSQFSPNHSQLLLAAYGPAAKVRVVLSVSAAFMLFFYFLLIYIFIESCS